MASAATTKKATSNMRRAELERELTEARTSHNVTALTITELRELVAQLRGADKKKEGNTVGQQVKKLEKMKKGDLFKTLSQWLPGLDPNLTKGGMLLAYRVFLEEKEIKTKTEQEDETQDQEAVKPATSSAAAPAGTMSEAAKRPHP